MGDPYFIAYALYKANLHSLHWFGCHPLAQQNVLRQNHQAVISSERCLLTTLSFSLSLLLILPQPLSSMNRYSTFYFQAMLYSRCQISSFFKSWFQFLSLFPHSLLPSFLSHLFSHLWSKAIEVKLLVVSSMVSSIIMSAQNPVSFHFKAFSSVQINSHRGSQIQRTLVIVGDGVFSVHDDNCQHPSFGSRSILKIKLSFIGACRKTLLMCSFALEEFPKEYVSHSLLYMVLNMH